MNENRIFIHFEPLAKSQKKEHLGVGTPMIFSTLWEVIAASTDTCEPRKYPDAERRRDTYAAHKYPEMRQLLPISALIVPLVH